MAVTTNQVQSLYLAYFGRPAEPAGLTYWTSQANATVDQISAAFAQQPEYTSVYAGLTRAQTINQLYQNLFGRTAASNELSYWQNSGDITVDRLALALTNGATGTDRLLLDGKTQYASSVTSNLSSTASASDAKAALTNATIITAVSSAGAATTQTLSAYQTANASNPNATANFYQQAAVQVANQNKVSVTGALLGDGNGVAISGGANFKDATAGTITLNNASSSSAIAVGLAATNKATDLTLSGTSGVATGGTGAATNFVLTEGATTKIVNTLHLNITDSAVANTATGFDVTGLTALTTVDGANSTSGLTINTTSLSAIANVTTGSGADFLTVGTTAANAVALTVNSGAGNDNVTANVGTAALTVNSGDGNDTLTLKGGSAVLTVNAGAGNDTVNLAATASVASTVTAAHNEVITLGAGNDVVNFNAALANIQNYSATSSTSTAAQVTAADNALKAGLVTITDFNTGTDQLNFGVVTGGTAGSNSVVSLTNAQTGAISAATSLSAAVQLAASDLVSGSGSTATVLGKAVAFQYGSDTYVFVDGGATAGTVDATGDSLIQLSGVTATQLTAANFTHA